MGAVLCYFHGSHPQAGPTSCQRAANLLCSLSFISLLPSTGKPSPHASKASPGVEPYTGGPRLDQIIQHFLHWALAPSTHHSYEAAHKCFLSFCTKIQSSPLPVTETLLCWYVASLADQKLKYQAIKCYLSAVRFLQIMSSFSDPNMSSIPILEYRGVKLEQANLSKQSNDQRQLAFVFQSPLLFFVGYGESLIKSLPSGKTSCSGWLVVPVSSGSFGRGK